MSLELNLNPKIDKAKFEEQIKELEINLMERAHGKMENLGQRFIGYRTLEELKTIEHNDYLFDAIMFLCFQYFRTKRMRSAVIESFKGTAHENLIEKSWNILSYVNATNLARNLSLDPNLRFIWHENNTEEHFITCDQPVFNILSDVTNENNEVTKLEFYYPISPNRALTIHFRNDQEERYIANDIQKDSVNYYNQKVMENADYYVFADSKEQLENLKVQK